MLPDIQGTGVRTRATVDDYESLSSFTASLLRTTVGGDQTSSNDTGPRIVADQLEALIAAAETVGDVLEPSRSVHNFVVEFDVMGVGVEIHTTCDALQQLLNFRSPLLTVP